MFITYWSVPSYRYFDLFLIQSSSFNYKYIVKPCAHVISWNSD